MSYPNHSLTWEDALAEYVSHLTATRAEKTVKFDRTQITQLIKWANAEGIAFQDFGKRHMDRYIVYRREQGRARLTLRHDGVCAKKFFAWCARNDLLERSRLADYEVHNAPKPPRYMPSDADVVRFFEALQRYWDPQHNHANAWMSPARSLFYRDRSIALYAGLVATGCRIGEIVSLKVDDYDPNALTVTFRETKGKEQRVVPVSAQWAKTMEVWLRVRKRVMLNVPAGEDEGWLFMNDTGGKIDPLSFIKTLHRITDWAGLPRLILHDFRRFSINKHVLENPFLTQHMVGHKDPKTTQGYSKLTAEDVRVMQKKVDLLGAVMSAKRPQVRKQII